MRLHILGASGSGTTTLGRALAASWSVPCHDTDDYYWLPTDPPFSEKRPVQDRLALMHALFVPRRDWVLSGHLCSWGGPLIPYFDAVVFVSLDNGVRLNRLRERERQRYGEAQIAEGGERQDAMAAFLAWAERYEDPAFSGRSRATHEAWLAALDCPVIRADSGDSVDQLVCQISNDVRNLGFTP